jgi:3-hydroxyacyl-CoA dehydrogenase
MLVWMLWSGVMTGLFNEQGDDRYRPSALWKRMVMAGKLGKKRARGFTTTARNSPSRGDGKSPGAGSGASWFVVSESDVTVDKA